MRQKFQKIAKFSRKNRKNRKLFSKMPKNIDLRGT